MTNTGPLLHDAIARSLAYLDGLVERGVAPTAEALAALDRLDIALPEHPTDAADVLALLDDAGSPATMAQAGGRYFGFVNGATLPAALAAHILATTWDQNAALAVMSPVAVRMQAIVSRWVIDVLGLPAESAAFFVGGATVASVSGLVAGRDHVLGEVGWNVPDNGLIGAPPVAVVVGEKAHSTIGKALALVGLGRQSVHVVAADTHGAMRADALAELDLDPALPTIVCAQAGEVNSGAFDPFAAIVDWAKNRNSWVHVDGAFGLWAAASPTRRHLTSGMAGADSWGTDGHKWLNVPYDSGIVIVRDPAKLRTSLNAAADYLPSDGLEPMHHVPQSSQRARAVDAWAAMLNLGRDGLADLIDRTSDLALRFAAGMTEAGYPPINEVVINQVLIRFPDTAADGGGNAEVMARLQQSGEAWCSGTMWHGEPTMRFSVSSWATTEADIDRAIAAVLAAAG